MVYESDTAGIRDAKEKVDDAKREIAVANIQKEIDLLKNQKDLLNEQITLLDEQSDAIKEYYDEQIKSTEKYFQELSKLLENQKSKFEQLQDILDEAKMKIILDQLGIDMDALLSGSEEEFNKLRDGYLGVIKSMTDGNTALHSAIGELAGVDMSNITGALDEVYGKADAVKPLAEATDTLNTNASKAADSLGKVADNADASAEKTGELKTNAGEVASSLSSVNTEISNLEKQDISNLTTDFNLLADAIHNVAKALGIETDDTVGSLMSAFHGLQLVSLDNGIITQFNNLYSAVSKVTSAIAGGGNESASNQNSQSSSNTGGQESEGSATSLTGAIDTLATEGVEKIQQVSDAFGGEDGESGVAGAVQNVIDKIGTEDTADDEGNLMSSLALQTEKALDEDEGIPAQQRAWEELNGPLGEATEYVLQLKQSLEDMDGKTFTVTLNVNGSGANVVTSGVFSSGAKINGTANVQGNWGAEKSEKTLVGEEGREIWVHRDTGMFETVGDNGAEFINLKQNDIIFNHKQTEQLLKNGHTPSYGTAHANGTVDLLSTGLRYLYPGDAFYDLSQKWDAYMQGKNINDVLLPLSSIQKNTDEMTRSIQNVSNVTNNSQRNVEVHQNITLSCPNVTNNSGVEYINKELGDLARKALQVSMKH